MKPVNMTEDEEKLWQRVETLAEDLVRDTGAAVAQLDRLPEWMQDAAMNRICDRLADAKAMVFGWAAEHGEP